LGDYQKRTGKAKDGIEKREKRLEHALATEELRDRGHEKE